MHSKVIGLVVFLAVTAFPVTVGESTASHANGSSIAVTTDAAHGDPGGGEGPNI